MSHHDEIDFNETVAKWSRLEAFNYSGGVPTSLERSSQQWDFPNVWPPLVEMVVTALENVRPDWLTAAQQWQCSGSRNYKLLVLDRHYGGQFVWPAVCPP